MSNITTDAKLQEWVTSLNSYATELTNLVGIMRDENCDLNNYVFPPMSINRSLMAAGHVGGIKRRKVVIHLLEELSDSLTVLATMLQDEDNRNVKAITHHALTVNLTTTYDMLTPLAVEGLNSYGEARQAVMELQNAEKIANALGLPLELDAAIPTPMSEVTPLDLTGDPLTLDVDEVVKTTNPNVEYFNLVTDIHRAVEIKFEQHDKYFGGYDETDMTSLMDCGYLIGRELNDFLGSVIDEEDKLPNGISLLELIIIINNLAFIANLATINSPIRSFELYVWNVNKFLPDVVVGEVGVLQQTLNRLKGLAERLHSHTGVVNTLNRLFAFGLEEGISARGSRSSGMCDEFRGRAGPGDVIRDPLTHSRSFGDDHEGVRYRQAGCLGRRGRYSR